MKKLGDKLKFSQWNYLTVFALICGLFTPSFSFVEANANLDGVGSTSYSGVNHNPSAIKVAQNVTKFSITLEKLSPKTSEPVFKAPEIASHSAIDLIQDIADSSKYISKAPKIASHSAIDLIQDIANSSKYISKAPKLASHSAIDLVQKIAIVSTKETNQKSKEITVPDVEKIQQLAQTAIEPDIRLNVSSSKLGGVAENGNYSNLPEFSESSDDPFSEVHTEYPPIKDPYENYNRFMQGVNDGMYSYMIEPVATVYRDWIPLSVRLGILNIFANAASPVNFVSSLVQGDLDKAVRVIGRLVVNSTVGLGGIFDVAGNYYDLKPVNEDFEQALGSYDIASGPYLVLPFFGPSSPRNLVGRVVDSVLNPAFWFSPSFVVGAGITAEDRVNSSSFTVDDYKDLKDNAVDPYISLRDFNHQYREKLIQE